MVDISKYGALAAQADNLSIEQKGGEREVPAAGPTGMRFVRYIEVGVQVRTIKGVPQEENQVWLGFEPLGKKHKPGTLLNVKMKYSRDNRSGFFQLFQRMNHDGKATHFVQLLGQAFKGTITHREGSSTTFVDVDHKTVVSPKYEVMDEDGQPTGQFKVMAVPEATLPIKAFLWDHSDLEDWDALHIEGEYPSRTTDDGRVLPAKSKNVIQEAIKGAKNYPGSRIQRLLAAPPTPVAAPEIQEAVAAAAAEATGESWDDIPE